MRGRVALVVVLAAAAACSELPIKVRDYAGTYVMNRGRAADTLILEAQGRYRRIYAMPGQTVAIDAGTWAADTFHGDVYIGFATFWPRWRSETDPSSLWRTPVVAAYWRALPKRAFTGRIRLEVDDDLDWAYVQRRRGGGH
jgi:hypothetical protein